MFAPLALLLAATPAPARSAGLSASQAAAWRAYVTSFPAPAASPLLASLGLSRLDQAAAFARVMSRTDLTVKELAALPSDEQAALVRARVGDYADALVQRAETESVAAALERTRAEFSDLPLLSLLAPQRREVLELGRERALARLEAALLAPVARAGSVWQDKSASDAASEPRAAGGRARALPAAWRLRASAEPVKAEIDAAFAALAPEVAKTLESVYAHELTQFYGDMRSTPDTGAAHALGMRYERGDEHARTALLLGFRKKTDMSGQPMLLPPDDLPTLFASYEAQMRRLLSDGALTEEDVIRPALVFSRLARRSLLPVPKKEYRFVRPGFDPWPAESEGWKWAEGEGELPGNAWHEGIAQGRMPFPITRIALHDMAHLTELVAHPEIMRQGRRYSREWRVSPRRRRSEMARSWILSETFALPDLAREAEIRALLPAWFSVGGLRTLDDGRRALAARTPLDRKRHLQALAAAAEPLMLRHGGTLRDHYNMQRWDADYEILARLTRESGAKGRGLRGFVEHHLRQSDMDIKLAAARESLMSRARELRLLVDLRYRGAALTTPRMELDDAYPYSFPLRRKDAAAELLSLPPEVRNARIDALLDDKAVRFEMALYQAVRLRLTPSRVHQDARLQAPAADSPTYAFFKSFVPKDSWYEKAFQLNR